MIKVSPLKAIIFMNISALLSVIGQVLWKISALQISFELIFGFLLYGIGAIFMIQSYKYSPITFIQPFMSLSYIYSMFAGFLLFHENFSLNKVLAILFITLGLILISKNHDIS